MNPFKDWYDREVRRGHEPNQSQIARDLGVEHQTVWNWLNGKSKPAANILYKLHKLTEIDPKVLLRWAAEKKDEDDL